VSNPAFLNDNGKYVPNDFDAAAPSMDPYTMFPIERTYSEWLMSSYNSDTGIYAPQFGGNKQRVSTCQDCHMRDVTGMGCNKKGAPVRNDLPLHDLTGGNTFIPLLLEQLFPGEVDPAAIDAGIARATDMLQKAASMTLNVTPNGTGYTADVRVTNETGHKLPSGYPEGRRIWLNLKVYDASGTVIKESGAYDFATGVLTHDVEAKIYEIKPGLTAGLASLLGHDPGPGFHFVVNDTIFSDNRIPPRGFSNGAFDAIQSGVVAYSYAEGQYWDDTQYDVPAEAAKVTVTLYYQTLSKEYVTFLRDENRTDDWGNILSDLWDTNGKSAPVAMNTQTFDIEPVVELPPVADFSGTPQSGDAPLTVAFTDLSTNTPTSWSWDFGDGGTSTEQNPSYAYVNPGAYTVALTATNAFGSDTQTKINYITVTVPSETFMHVADITVTREGKKNQNAIATVTVVDQDGVPVSGATVLGYFNAPNNAIKTGVTDGSGVAVITSDRTRSAPADWCFTVTDVQLSGATYDAAANVVTTACESGPAAMGAMYHASDMPNSSTLHQNYPNPFNPTTEISFTLSSASHVKLEVFNIVGQQVATLVDGQLGGGYHTFTFDGNSVASGVYFYRLTTEDYAETRSMVLLK
jgi:PKD repeat protein